MQILSLNFLLFALSGMWRPIKWSSNHSKLLYSLFTFFSIHSLIFLFLTQFLNIIYVNNMEDCTMNCFLCLSTISVFFKAVAAITRRDQIINIIRMLEEKPCKACNEEEIDILMKFDYLIR